MRKLFISLLTIFILLSKPVAVPAQSELIGVPIYFVDLNAVAFAAIGLDRQGYLLDHVEDEAGYYPDGTEKVIMWVHPLDCEHLTGSPKPYPGATCYQGPGGVWGWR